MSGSKHWFRFLFIACAGALAVQVIGLSATPAKATLSNVLIAAMGTLATAGCIFAAYRFVESRKLWTLLGLGFLLSTVGQILSIAYELETGRNYQTTAILSDFLFFAYGIPILLAVCSGHNEEGLRSLLWLDAAQATLASVLTYVQIFSALPAFGGQVPISSTHLMVLYDVENVILAAVTTLRLFSNPLPNSRRFYENLAIYLWVYGLVALGVGYLELGRTVPDGLQDAAWGVPYLVFLGALAFRKEREDVPRGPVKQRQTLSLLVDNLSPVLFR